VAIHDPGYEVAWQMEEDDGGEGLAEVPTRASRPPREKLEPLCRFAGLLAEAEVAAVALCRGEGLIIELTQPPAAWLPPGTFMRAQPRGTTDDGWDIASLLRGQVRWTWCKPPAGCCSAALVRGSWLVATGRLLLLANRDGRLSEVNLGLAASYLAQTWWPAPKATASPCEPNDRAEAAPQRRPEVEL
jgi:hypothetical protein